MHATGVISVWSSAHSRNLTERIVVHSLFQIEFEMGEEVMQIAQRVDRTPSNRPFLVGILAACVLTFANVFFPEGVIANVGTIRGTEEFIYAFFGLSLIMERASEVLLAIWLRTEKIEIRDRIAAAKAGLKNLYEPPQSVTSETQLSQAKEIVLNEKLDYKRFKLRVAQYAILFNLCLGLCISLVGFRALRYFISPNDAGGTTALIQGYLFNGLDALLTAAVLAGGSKGVHTFAMTLLRFANEVIKSRASRSNRGAS